MAQDDWAIVVGIRRYPGLDNNLEGPENDATAFYEWLRSPTGGDVPRKQIELILSSDFKYAGNPDDAMPTAERVHRAITKLHRLGVAKGETRYGRRLYLYLAGHGFAPRDDQTAVLAANATLDEPFHVLGPYNADYFYKAGYFKEILLFMDCCRELYSVAAPNMPYRDKIIQCLPSPIRFYGYAAHWSQLARERPTSNGLWHGVFTTALLAGLRGAAAEPNSGGLVTADSLRNYLLNSVVWEQYFSPEDLADPTTPLYPEIHTFEGNFTIVKAPAPTFPIKIHLPPASAGKEIEILSGETLEQVCHAPAAPPLWEISLERGGYLAQILVDGLQRRFEVTGIGEVHVNF